MIGETDRLRDHREDRRRVREARRARADAVQGRAGREAEAAGLRLVRHDDGAHYQLIGKSGWMIDFYPATNRIRREGGHTSKAPWLAVAERDGIVNLLDVVRAAVAAEGRRS